MKTYKGTFQPKQHYQAKMTPDELQEHIKMCRLGASQTHAAKDAPDFNRGRNWQTAWGK